MAAPVMTPRRLGLMLALLHGGLGWLATLLPFDWLSALVAGSIYLPLWPFHALGVPVFAHHGAWLPPPTWAGWLLLGLLWGLGYQVLAHGLCRTTGRRS